MNEHAPQIGLILSRHDMALHYLPSLPLSIRVRRGRSRPRITGARCCRHSSKTHGTTPDIILEVCSPSLPFAQIVHCEFATDIAIAKSLFSFSNIRYSIDSAVVILVQGNFLLSCSWYSGIALWPISNSGMLIKNPPSPGAAPGPRPLLFPPSYGQNKDGFPCFFAGPRCH